MDRAGLVGNDDAEHLSFNGIEDGPLDNDWSHGILGAQDQILEELLCFRTNIFQKPLIRNLVNAGLARGWIGVDELGVFDEVKAQESAGALADRLLGAEHLETAEPGCRNANITLAQVLLFDFILHSHDTGGDAVWIRVDTKERRIVLLVVQVKLHARARRRGQHLARIEGHDVTCRHLRRCVEKVVTIKTHLAVEPSYLVVKLGLGNEIVLLKPFLRCLQVISELG
mmetsp:Transcript_32834/g.82438  ORF Transcript_32834/g.82438 Transcript_32834/m.82438 type:complete len:227 (+) Transcript_32834:2350-3030(+)